MKEFSKRSLLGLLVVVAACTVLLGPGRLGYKNLWLSWKLLSSGDQIGARMILYTNWHAYDKAVQAGLNALRNEPRNDAFVYGQIAVVYLARAQADKNHREQWIALATTYVDKELSIYRNRATVNPGFDLLQVGGGLATAGNLSVRQPCVYYRRAVEILMEAAAASQGDHVILSGTVVPLQPQRVAIERACRGRERKLPMPDARNESSITDRLRDGPSDDPYSRPLNRQSRGALQRGRLAASRHKDQRLGPRRPEGRHSALKRTPHRWRTIYRAAANFSSQAQGVQLSSPTF